MSHVKTYSRTDKKTGKVTVVKSHDDKRTKSGKKRSSWAKHFINAPDPGMIKMREAITDLLHTEKGREELTEKIKTGGFAKTIPEVLNLYGVEQGEHHPLPDAFDHTMELFKHLPADASDNILWATLLHDIGKVETQTFHKTRGVIFDGHEHAGYKMVEKVLTRLGFNKTDSAEISYLVLHHGNLRTQILRAETSAAHKFVKHPNFGSLLTLHKADVYASGRDPHEVVERHDLLLKTEDFRKDLYDRVSKELGAKKKAVELNDDGSVSLYLDNDKELTNDQGNVDLKVQQAADAILKKHSMKNWEAGLDYDEQSGWVGVHFEPKTPK